MTAIRFLLLFQLFSISAFQLFAEGRRPNILFIAVDDLRPELGCYGNPVIQTPHFDKFAAQGVLFSRTHCQAAACAP